MTPSTDKDPERELQDKCIEIQASLGIDDKRWKELFGNEKGLYGFIASQATPKPVVPGEGELIEKLAAIEHERWADWQKWMHGKGEPYTTGADKIGLLFRQGYIDHLERQIATPYGELTEAEKQSDRDQVMRYWPLIQEYIASQVTAAQERAVLEARIEMLEHYFAIAPNEIPDRIAVLKSQLASLHKGKDKEST